MSKPTLYILHGWTKDVSKWPPLVKLLGKAGFTVKLLKIPGLTAPLDKVWGLNNYADWLAGQIKNDPSAILIAHSNGGRIAIRYETKNPDRVKKLILIDSAGIRPMSLAARVKRASFMTIAKIGKKITQNPGARSILYKLAKEQDYYQADKTLAQTMVNIINEDQRPEIGFVKAHTLILWGRQDSTTPLSDGRLINKEITGSTLKIIEDAGHAPQYTHPDIVADHILQFLKHAK